MDWEIDFLKYIIENVQMPILDKIMFIITSLGNAGFIWILIVIVFILIKRYRKMGVTMAISLFMNFLVVNCFLKPIFNRSRPFEVSQEILNSIMISLPQDNSFPSGHTSAAFAVAMVCYLCNKKIGSFLICFAFLMGLSRLYFSVHFPTDVIFGVIIGIFTSIVAYKIYFEKNEKNSWQDGKSVVLY